jgi:serine protease
MSFVPTASLLVAAAFFVPFARAENKLGNESLTLDVNRVLGTAGISRIIPEQPSTAVSALPFVGKVKPAGASATAPDVTGLIIRFRSDDVKLLSRENQPPPQALIDEVARLAGSDLIFVRAMSMDAYVFRFASPLHWGEAQSAIDRIKTSPNVEAVDADARSDHSVTPNDTYASSQWNLKSSTVYAGSANLGPAWDITQGSNSTIVAVVDTGVRPHPELFSRLLPGYDFVSTAFNANDGGGRDADASDPGDWSLAGECGTGTAASNSSWHGTHVTGTIAATGNNADGIAGVNWNTRILPVRVLGKCGGSVSDIVDGMIWAAGLTVPGVPLNPFPAKVINMSLGGSSPTGCLPDSPYQVAINRIKSTGALIVVAAGNDDTEAGTFVPAACNGVMTVAAVGPTGGRASYSNYSTQGNVDISAPGGDFAFGDGAGILSTINSGKTTPELATYGYKQGTSMAAPHVAGVASLALGLDPAI